MRILKFERLTSIAKNVTKYLKQEGIHRRGFQDVVPIQMLAGCTSGISSALIG